MHAQFIGSPALIPFLVSQHDQNEHSLELSHGFLESHAVSIHLQYKILELRLHNGFPKTLKSECAPRKETQDSPKVGKCQERRTPKGKGRDIGYALAVSSCEEANSVEACTITAPDVITAFAVPNPNYSSQSCRFFRVWLPGGLPRWADHPIYFGLANFI